MINSTYNPARIGDFDKNRLQVNDQCAMGTAIAGQSTSIDLAITDDHLLTGIQVLAKGTVFGDTITMEVVDVMGTLPNGLSFPPNSVLNKFGTTLGIVDDTELKFNEESEYPAKIFGGLVLRVIYNSTGASNVAVEINYKLHKVLE